MSTYEECLANMKSFMNSLSYTNIDYVSFFANNLKKPRIKSKFRQWTIYNDKYYILEGIQENTIYVYKETHVQNILLNADTNQGDYLEFQIYKTKTGGIIVKTHFIQFQDILEDNVYSRDNPKCNFTLLNDNVQNKTFEEFMSVTTCNDVNGNSLQRICENKEYPKYVKQCIFALCNVLINNTYVNEKSKNIHLMTDEDIEFLTQRYFMNIVDVPNGLQTVTVLYEKRNKNICIIYDFEDNTRDIQYLQSNLIN